MAFSVILLMKNFYNMLWEDDYGDLYYVWV